MHIKDQTPIATIGSMLIVSCMSVCSVSIGRFSRDVSLDNKNIADELAGVQTSLTIHECARGCHSNASCVSFLHNQDGGRCHHRSRVYIHEQTVLEEGSRTFVKNNGICRRPEVINKGRVLYTDGLAEGSRAEFVCDDYYFPASVAGVCDSLGIWLGLDSPCHQDITAIAAAGRVFPGACVVVLGTPTQETVFVIRLKEVQEDTTNMLMSARFNANGDHRQIVLTSRFNGVSNPEERESTIWPFTVNQEFNVTICTEETLYRIFVDSVEFSTYNFRGIPTDVVTIKVDGAVTLRSVHFIDSISYTN